MMGRHVAALVAAAAIFVLSASAASAQSSPRAAPTPPAAQTQDLGPPSAAPTTPVDVSQAPGEAGPQINGINIYNLFMRADPIVKVVMALLVLASLWSWAIIINKWIAIATLKRRANQFEKTFWSGLSLDELYAQFAQKPDHPMASVFTAAIREWRRAFEQGPPRDALLPGIRDRVEKAMTVSIQRETDGVEGRLGFLATVGATAPFVGLFGTVWGIMSAFHNLGNVQQATLAAVAPGIAEALITTAIGLFAAIPAVIAYNRFADQVSRLELRFDTFVEEFSTILQRHGPVRASNS